MRTRKFEWAAKMDGYGRNHWGWKPVDSPPNFYPGTGLIVAHDTIEHFNNDASFKGELMALGATLFGRMHKSIFQALISAEDISGFLKNERFVVPKPNRRWSKPLPVVAERMLQHFLSLLRPMVRSTLLVDVDVMLNDIAAWARLGWRISARRFAGHNSDDALNLCRRLTNAVNHDHDDNHPVEGEILTVSVDFKALKYRLARSNNHQQLYGERNEIFTLQNA